MNNRNLIYILFNLIYKNDHVSLSLGRGHMIIFINKITVTYEKLVVKGKSKNLPIYSLIGCAPDAASTGHSVDWTEYSCRPV